MEACLDQLIAEQTEEIRRYSSYGSCELQEGLR